MKKSNAFNYLAVILAFSGTYLIQIITNMYLSGFCSTVLNLGPPELNFISKMMMCVSIICIFLYIVFGIIMNNTLLKSGRTKPWLIGISIPTTLSVCLMFFVPENISVSMQLVYISVFYVLSQVCLTILLIAINSMLVLMSNNLKTRSMLSWAHILVISALSFASTYIIPSSIYINYRISIIVYMGLSAFALVASGMLMREQHSREENSREIKKLHTIGTMNLFKFVVTNKYWLLITIISIISIISSSLQAGSHVYFMMYYINNMQLMSYISVITNFAGIAVLILMPFIIHRFDSLKLVIIGRFILVLSFVLCLFTNPNRMAFLFAGIVLQKVSEGFTSVSPAVNARLVDHLEYKNGIRPIHLVNALNLSTVSISTLVSNVFILGAGSQTHATNAAVAAELGKTSYYMYLAIPCILSAIIAIITLFFDLTDKKVNSMRSEIIENNRPQISD